LPAADVSHGVIDVCVARLKLAGGLELLYCLVIIQVAVIVVVAERQMALSQIGLELERPVGRLLVFGEPLLGTAVEPVERIMSEGELGIGQSEARVPRDSFLIQSFGRPEIGLGPATLEIDITPQE